MSDPFADCGQCRSALRLFSNLRPKIAAGCAPWRATCPRTVEVSIAFLSPVGSINLGPGRVPSV